LFELYAKGIINYHEALYTATSPTDLKIVLDNYDIKKSKAEKEKDVQIYMSEDDGEKSEEGNITVDMDDKDILDLKI
jgi:hypothetical protein